MSVVGISTLLMPPSMNDLGKVFAELGSDEHHKTFNAEISSGPPKFFDLFKG